MTKDEFFRNIDQRIAEHNKKVAETEDRVRIQRGKIADLLPKFRPLLDGYCKSLSERQVQSSVEIDHDELTFAIGSGDEKVGIVIIYDNDLKEHWIKRFPNPNSDPMIVRGNRIDETFTVEKLEVSVQNVIDRYMKAALESPAAKNA